jgi:hypothetical protein
MRVALLSFTLVVSYSSELCFIATSARLLNTLYTGEYLNLDLSSASQSSNGTNSQLFTLLVKSVIARRTSITF